MGAPGMHVRSYDGTSAPRLADFGGVVWMLAAARRDAWSDAATRRKRAGDGVGVFACTRIGMRNRRVAMRGA